MPSVSFFKFRFTPNWVMIVLTVFILSLFLRLGFWQLHRADEKKQMIEAQKIQEHAKPVLWTPKQPLPLQYERLQLVGHYLPNIFLLDNQHHQHIFGYDVLSPLECADGSIVLIDRGWVPGDMTRGIFPSVTTPKGLIQIQGSVYFPDKKQWVLGPVLEKKGNKTTIIELFDEQLVRELLQKVVYPFIIRLDKQNTDGFVREWEIVSMLPERHVAYAIQWFAMAFVILVIFLALNLKKKNEQKVP